MKYLKTGIASLCCLFAVITTKAQTTKSLPVREPDYNKPLLFEQSSQRSSCRVNDLQNILKYTTGQQVSFNLSDNFIFSGVVTSTANKEDGRIISVVIRSTNYDGATLSLSKVRKEDGSSYYTGRIISFRHGDGFEIIEENGQYVLIKKGFYDMVNE